MPEIKKTASWAILSQLAAQNRRILSDWRAVVLLRRATNTIPPTERRWVHAPVWIGDIREILNYMVRREEIRPVPDLSGIYEVTVPYAHAGLVEEDEILMEVHPYATLSHLSALVFHSLTDDLPKGITALMPSAGRDDLLPLGTQPVDWESLAPMSGKPVSSILERPVRWTRTDPSRYFGFQEYTPRGYPVRVTTPERTLLDSLQRPELCGGGENALQAWVRARDLLNIELLISYVNRLDIAILRQRVGFVLEELGLSHPALDVWQQSARRGGSSKLVGSAPYASNYSDRWNLSLNGPIAVLHESD